MTTVTFGAPGHGASTRLGFVLRIALAQINPTVGDVGGNARLVRTAMRRAEEAGAQVVAVPELAVPGYPPEDLLLKPSFIRANAEAIEGLARDSRGVLAVVGFAEPGRGGALYNSAALLHRGRVVAVYRKHLLPNYGVFDERRYFTPGRGHVLTETPHGVLGVCVCEDAWFERGPVTSQGDAGAQVVININASPFHRGKMGERTEMLARRARRAESSIVYLNSVGGQDELVFDGGSLVLDPSGAVVARLPQFEEAFAVVDVPLGAPGAVHDPSIRTVHVDLDEATGKADDIVAPVPHEAEEIYGALTLGLRDYAAKNGFKEAVIGLSGGIDSSLTATIAADALRPENVLGVLMPSEFSTEHSITDAQKLAINLGIETIQIPIKAAYKAYMDMLDDIHGEQAMGLAEENLQARIRGNLVMFISNRYGHLVLATGNKSESAVGYSTLYGDMAGGLSVLKDLLKRDVYACARWRNRRSAVIPENVLTKAPSAELRPGQRDEDSLPPYDELDPILEAYIEDDASFADIVAAGHDPATVERVVTLVDHAEYKRRQAPPGIKVTTKAFGRDRRLPITNRWRERADMPPNAPG